MEQLLVFLLILASCTQYINADEKGRIVGGYDTNISSCGWHVSLHNEDEYICGGSIIAKDWILTSTQCVKNIYKEPLNMIVRAGSNFPDKEGYIYQVKTIIRHPRYNEYVADEFDVALLRLNNSIRFTPCNKVSIDLPEAGKDVPAGSFLSVTGWGATEEGGLGSETLQRVELRAVSDDDCKKGHEVNNDIITDSMMCAGVPEGGKDTCRGDSGGALVDENMVQIGVASWRRGCGRPDSPSVYAKLSNPEIRGFIKKYTDV